ncbi:hypothetical protein CIHG_07628 [Coccidioides immitis H538.4]|uniref:Uncharacterized protein n=2 Tax=Coccidioides immitis TaxID=5501 RepID=A0A0J8RXQ6_COCIT|nr:hypothetical protein CIRG_07917 [Coccidioides immitis RMSCC 2394]KMU89945.1 hypothetical protein CIHG_07628 [Coccidioides immitis H538.4]TPX19908.1 hypothetical protein DIZ76_017702 [Coccidioides immitis]
MTNFFHQIYLSHANRVVTDYITRGRRHKISRAQIEMQILKEIEKSSLPSAYRVSWYALVLQSDTFDIYWLGQRDQHHLSKESIARLKPDESLIEECVFESPESSPACSDREMSNSPQAETTAEGVSSISSSSSNDDDGTIDNQPSSASDTPPIAQPESEERAEAYKATPAETLIPSIEGGPVHPHVSGKTISEIGVIPGTSRKTTPRPAQPARKARKTTATASTPKKQKATRMKAPSKKKPKVALKKPRVTLGTTTEESEKDREPMNAEPNGVDPELQMGSRATSAGDRDQTKTQERVKKAWETRRRKAAEKAAEKAAAKAVALAQEEGTATCHNTVVQPAASPAAKAGKGRGRKKKAVRFNLPETNLDGEENIDQLSKDP